MCETVRAAAGTVDDEGNNGEVISQTLQFVSCVIDECQVSSVHEVTITNALIIPMYSPFI